MGGGWCYSAIDCLGRSKTNLGSSLKWPKTYCAGGMMADDPVANPDFASFNRVVLAYCDGNSFASNRDDPVPVTTTDADGTATTSTIYWRGKRLIDATLATLVEKHGLGDASTVLLTGASAGGLAGYLHADYVHEKLQTLAPKMQKYRAAPISGFFLDHDNVMGESVYGAMIKNLYTESNATGGVNRHCVAATPPDEQWKCNFASGSYAHTEAPIFALNSALDSWQTGCIFAATLDPGFPKTTPKVRAPHPHESIHNRVHPACRLPEPTVALVLAGSRRTRQLRQCWSGLLVTYLRWEAAGRLQRSVEQVCWVSRGMQLDTDRQDERLHRRLREGDDANTDVRQGGEWRFHPLLPYAL
jgi:hypothetical protein